jgi:hypothetical protein
MQGADLALEIGTNGNGQDHLTMRATLRGFFEIGPRRLWRWFGLAGAVLVQGAVLDSMLGLGIFPSSSSSASWNSRRWSLLSSESGG